MEFIKKSNHGIDLKDIFESYSNAEKDIDQLYDEGELIILKKGYNLTSRIVFPRNERYLINLPSNVKFTKDSDEVKTFGDLTSDIRRGECLIYGNRYYRSK